MVSFTVDVPYITTDQMIKVDRAMVEDFHIEIIQMMENAGYNLARLARSRFLNGNPVGKKIVILTGTGGNGGGALVCARHLDNWGADVQVFLTKSTEEFKGVSSHQLDILERMQVPIAQSEGLVRVRDIDLIVDGIIGYNLAGAPGGTAAQLIYWANVQKRSILALDVPSGLDATTGKVYTPAICAAATMALALPKIGFKNREAKSMIGELYLADIGIPLRLYTLLDISVDLEFLFSQKDILRLY